MSTNKKKKKTRSKPGKRYPFLLYRRTMDRMWGITLFLGLALLALWWYGNAYSELYRGGWVDTLILLSWIMALGVSAIAFFGRFLSYVQPNADHLVIRTPFFKLKVHYKRFTQVHTTEFHKIFDPEKFTWAERTYLDPFIGDTAVVVIIREYPVSPNLLKFFFPQFLFYPRDKGFVILVPDWMKFSEDLDSRYSTYQQKHSPRPQGMMGGFQRGMYKG